VAEQGSCRRENKREEGRGRSAKRGSVPRDEGRSATQACHVVAGHGLDPLGPVVRPEQQLGTGMTHFLSLWTEMTQRASLRNVGAFYS
jgi:hypothetical protein